LFYAGRDERVENVKERGVSIYVKEKEVKIMNINWSESKPVKEMRSKKNEEKTGKKGTINGEPSNKSTYSLAS
jgi:hypothetical protein